MSWDIETDVAVVGAGGCGLMAAFTAATYRGGVDVVLLEKNQRLPPTSAIAGGYLQAAGTRFQKAAGIDDSPEMMAEDIFKKNHGKSDREVTLAVCRKSADVIHAMVDELGLPLEFAPEVAWLGHSRPRMHAHPSRSGGPVVATIRERVLALPNVIYADNTPGQGLITDESGAVVGVLAGPPGDEQRIKASKVILAAGGFGANREMLVKYIPELADALYIGTQTHTGEAILWGIEAGAAVEHMRGYQGHGFIVHGFGTRVNPGIVYLGGIFVNIQGERFEREDQGYSEWAGVVVRQPGGYGICIWDDTIQEQVGFISSMVESEKAGAIVHAPTIAALAERLGLDPARLEQTVADYNRGVAEQRDPLGRESMVRQLEPPFHAAKITGALAHTQGGLKVDVHGRVLRPDGQPVPNLYAGGNVAVGVSGDTPDGYTSGNGLLMAYTLGRLAGEHAVNALKSA